MGSDSRSNPKHASLTGYKMAGLWQEVRLTTGVIYRILQSLIQYRSKYQSFRDRWGNKPPRSDREWLTFWQEFVSLEDDLSSAQDRIMESHNVLMQSAEEGMEVVRLNGIDAIDDPISYLRRSLDRAAELVKINRDE